MATTTPESSGAAPANGSRRRRRKKLDRTGPIRNAATYFRAADADAPLHTTKNLVERTVELAYEVVEDQARAGQKIARRLRGEKNPVHQKKKVRSGDWIGRTLRVYQEIGLLGMEAIETLARRRGAMSILGRILGESSAERSGEPARAGSAPAPVVTYEIYISSQKYAEANLVFHSADPPAAPKVDALHGRETDKAISRRSIRFSPDQRVVRISIDAGQPPDFYSGAIFDGDQVMPVGLLWVRVLADDSEASHDAA